jgi:hypothetical protein
MANFGIRCQQVVVFVLGLAVAASSYWIDGWWLDSGGGLLRVVISLFTIGMLVALWQMASAWTSGAALWLGAFMGMGGVLFRVGPGTIWPIVLVVDAGISAVAVLAGVVTGVGINQRRRR